MRMKGALDGDGNETSLKSLYYLSCHSLDGNEHFRYGKSRVSRELMDLWVERKISYGGIRFEDDEPKLSQDDTSPNENFTAFCYQHLRIFKS